MKAFKKIVPAIAAVLLSSCFMACSDANEYEDFNDKNWSSQETQYNDSAKYTHPESLTGTYWVRGTGFKFNAYGEEIQGYVESIDFVDDTYVVVRMSKGILPESIKNTAVWVDDSNTDKLPQYEYKYAANSGSVEILKEIVDEKGKVSKVAIFTAVAVGETVVVSHYGDTPSQTYMVRGNRPVVEAPAPEVTPGETPEVTPGTEATPAA